MTREEIKELKNFSPDEKDVYKRLIFEKYEEINPELMARIDYAVSEAKKYYKTRFIVHDINLGEHSDGSQHYLGRAIDGHFTYVPLERQFFFCMLAGFKGIGIYYDWKTLGVHADIRDQDVLSVWYRNGEYNYNRKDFLEEIGL